MLISPAAEQRCQPYGPTGAEQLPLQPVLNMKPRGQQGLSQRLGTGRTVAHRAFDLMLRLPIAKQQPEIQVISQPTDNQAEICAVNVQTALLDKLQDISNTRRSQLQQHAGSGRAVTKRTFGLALAPIQTVSEPQAASQTPLQSALSTPQTAWPAASVNRMSAKSKKSSRASFGSAIEGILERPWRSISKTPAASRTPAPSSGWKYTPMEGVPERFEQPCHQSVRWQSHGSKLKTPGSTRQRQRQHLGSLGSTARPDILSRLQPPAGDEAQLQEVSPVVGLLEPQHQPDEQQQQTGAEQYGSLGFFGRLCSALPVTDTAGLDMQDVCDDMDVDGYQDFSDDADEQQTPWPAVLPGSGTKSASGRIAAETTPAGSRQQPSSGLHAGQSAHGGGSTGQRNTAWSDTSERPQDYSAPRFHEMEVQTGRSLQNSPAPSMADVAVLAQSPLAEQPDDTAQQAVEEDIAQPGPEAAACKHIRKSEAHHRLKEANKQRRSLAGEGLHGERGVRRSSRDKHAPLEYWRNERKVYNREFRSLPTVHHYATRTPSPSWKFVQDLPHRKKSRLAQKATEAK
ncbi:MAG: hypothetical protein FRX49_03655 [Trebouxia sp. A1-2]|nr:MAG: hypothetical protein FRX49_03655 [Trebouxia sp. A1-2]